MVYDGIKQNLEHVSTKALFTISKSIHLNNRLFSFGLNVLLLEISFKLESVGMTVGFV